MKPRKGIELALDYYTQAALARLIGTTQQTISRRVAGGQTFTAEEALAVESDGVLSRDRLRPDLWPWTTAEFEPRATETDAA